MALSLANLKKTSGNPFPLSLIYGPEKVGKTSLFAEFPAPVLVQTVGENPPADLAVDTLGIAENFDDLMSAFESLYVEDHDFVTLGIDALDGVERLVWAETCKRKGWVSIEEPDFGRGYVEADAVWAEIFDALLGLQSKGMMVVLIGHVEIKQFDDPANGSYSRFQPNLHKRAAAKFKAACDIIAFVNQRVSMVKEKEAFGAEKKRAEGSGTRVISLENRPGFVAGNRYSMPDSINYRKGKGFEELAKYLPKVAA